MGLFDRFKGKKTVDWSAAYTAEPKFYGRPDGTPFGATALEKAAPYRLDGRADAVLLRGLTAEELEGLMD